METQTIETVKLEITLQGAPIVSWAYVHEKTDNLVAIILDMKSKRCTVDGISISYPSDKTLGIPGIKIDATSASTKLDEAKDRDDSTFVEFPEYEGWSVFCSAFHSKYSIAVVLHR